MLSLTDSRFAGLENMSPSCLEAYMQVRIVACKTQPWQENVNLDWFDQMSLLTDKPALVLISRAGQTSSHKSLTTWHGASARSETLGQPTRARTCKQGQSRSFNVI